VWACVEQQEQEQEQQQKSQRYLSIRGIFENGVSPTKRAFFLEIHARRTFQPWLGLFTFHPIYLSIHLFFFQCTYLVCEDAWTAISFSTKRSETCVPVSTIISLKAVNETAPRGVRHHEEIHKKTENRLGCLIYIYIAFFYLRVKIWFNRNKQNKTKQRQNPHKSYKVPTTKNRKTKTYIVG